MGVEAMPLLLRVLAHCGDDKLIPAIVWQNLHPLLEDQATGFRPPGQSARPGPNA